MTIRTVGILSPGDMGSAIGSVLRHGGLDVVTSLEGRSELSRARAGEAGMRNAGSVDGVVREADLVLSVLVPAEAEALAERVAEAVRRTGARPPFVECNAIAPQTVERIGARLMDAGVSFIDAGIIGAPPKPGRAGTRIYCSGPDTRPFEELAEHGLDVRIVGPEIGQASGLKMVYAASTKGTIAVWTELLIAARALRLDDTLRSELGMGRRDVADKIIGEIPTMPRRSRRWVGEMEEIAKTFEGLGLTPRILQGAADLYQFIGDSPLGAQTSKEPDPSLDVLLETLTSILSQRRGRD